MVITSRSGRCPWRNQPSATVLDPVAGIHLQQH
jgi:hypothetical protein